VNHLVAKVLLDDIPACTQNLKDITLSITAEEKAKVLKEFATKEGDTGSPEVQLQYSRPELTH